MLNNPESQYKMLYRKLCILSLHYRLLIASQDGYLYVYSIPSVEGAECQLIKKHDLRLDECYAIDVRGKLYASYLILFPFFFIVQPQNVYE